MRPDEDFGSTADEDSGPEEHDLEAPDGDAAEQDTPSNPAEGPERVHRGDEVDEYDAVEQSRVVDLDDDYR